MRGSPSVGSCGKLVPSYGLVEAALCVTACSFLGLAGQLGNPERSCLVLSRYPCG